MANDSNWWFRISILAGVLASTIFLIVWWFPTTPLTWALVIGVAVLVFFLQRNPGFFYRKLASWIFLGVSVHAAWPSFTINFNLGGGTTGQVSRDPLALVIDCMFLLGAFLCLILDYKSRHGSLQQPVNNPEGGRPVEVILNPGEGNWTIVVHSTDNLTRVAIQKNDPDKYIDDEFIKTLKTIK